MSFARNFKNEIYRLLDAVTSADVLALDNEFKTAFDKHQLFREFEAVGHQLPVRAPALLERYTHYCWLRLELSYLIDQRIGLQKISAMQAASSAALRGLAAAEARAVPTVASSLFRAIQEDVERGVSIQDSIRVLQQVTLQTIGTEHPTDPLSQPARDALTKVAQAIHAPVIDPSLIKKLLSDLQTVDAIPPIRRDANEEVNRNINMALDKLYDSLPYLIETIFSAYQTYYGATLTALHEESIWQAMEGGLAVGGSVASPLERNGSWAGFDADGNENITPDVTYNAIRIHRIRIAEKHSAALEESVVQVCKKSERRLRDEIFALNDSQFRGVLSETNNKQIILSLQEAINKTSNLISNRDFGGLVAFYAEYKLSHPGQPDVFAPQYKRATLLNRLTEFSGKFKQNNVLTEGAVQVFQGMFKAYKDAIRENTDTFEIQQQNPTEFMIRHYQDMLEKHQQLLVDLPEIKRPARCFAIQLRSYGMTYGVAHIRQDSSMFLRVWNAILEDVKQTKQFESFSIVKLMQNRRYTDLSTDERAILHKQLQDGGLQSQTVLADIHHKHRAEIYSKEERYKQNPDYFYVRQELDRIRLALRHHDMFENIIISNAESAANILEVESLLRVFVAQPVTLTVVPLLEKRQDLENYQSILHDHIKSKLPGQTVEVMVGFSDTERVSGLSALISIQKVQEDFIQLAEAHGLVPKIYYGPGGDPNRGGLKRRDEKGTLQGNARSNILNTKESIERYRETQFYQAYRNKSNPARKLVISSLPKSMQKALLDSKNKGAAFYEHLHDTEKGLGKLLGYMMGQGAHWLVTILNSSSRATQRGIEERQGDRTASVQQKGVRPDSYIHPDKPRAITATQIKEVLRDNIDLVFGPGYGLREMGMACAERLYDSVEPVRDLFHKTLFGLANADLSITAHALFAGHPELRPANEAERQQWVIECLEYPQQLMRMDVSKMAKTVSGRHVLNQMLGRLFAFIEVEYARTLAFFTQLNQTIHRAAYLHHSEQSTSSLHGSDLLYPHVAWQQQTAAVIYEVQPLSILLARMNKHVADGKNLDEVYRGLNDAKSYAASKLSGVGRLLGNVGSGVTAARIMPASFYDDALLNYTDNLRQGVTRAEGEAVQLCKSKVTLFAERQRIEDVLRLKLDSHPQPLLRSRL